MQTEKIVTLRDSIRSLAQHEGMAFTVTSGEIVMVTETGDTGVESVTVIVPNDSSVPPYVIPVEFYDDEIRTLVEKNLAA